MQYALAEVAVSDMMSGFANKIDFRTKMPKRDIYVENEFLGNILDGQAGRYAVFVVHAGYVREKGAVGRAVWKQIGTGIAVGVVAGAVGGAIGGGYYYPSVTNNVTMVYTSGVNYDETIKWYSKIHLIVVDRLERKVVYYNSFGRESDPFDAAQLEKHLYKAEQKLVWPQAEGAGAGDGQGVAGENAQVPDAGLQEENI